MSIIVLIDELHGVKNARRAYERFRWEQVKGFESRAEDFISDFIELTESKRKPFLKRLKIDDDTQILFLTLSAIGCVRAKQLLESGRSGLSRGDTYRATAAEAYRRVQTMIRKDSTSYDWPAEVAMAMGIDAYLEDEDPPQPPQGEPMIDQHVQERIDAAGELLIRAAAVLGSLTPEEQLALNTATDGGAIDSLDFALQALAKVSPSVRKSMKTHPPEGFASFRQAEATGRQLNQP